MLGPFSDVSAVAERHHSQRFGFLLLERILLTSCVVTCTVASNLLTSHHEQDAHLATTWPFLRRRTETSMPLASSEYPEFARPLAAQSGHNTVPSISEGRRRVLLFFSKLYSTLATIGFSRLRAHLSQAIKSDIGKKDNVRSSSSSLKKERRSGYPDRYRFDCLHSRYSSSSSLSRARLSVENEVDIGIQQRVTLADEDGKWLNRGKNTEITSILSVKSEISLNASSVALVLLFLYCLQGTLQQAYNMAVEELVLSNGR